MSGQKCTVWLGLCGSGHVIGPFFFQRNVNGNAYLQMINDEILTQLKEHFERQVRGVFKQLWWAQIDCARSTEGTLWRTSHRHQPCSLMAAQIT